jgi:7,8-dihydropterin-6-yl-methyl-4-(beta-D-ribofuranosyl)aminobenzene 5'-phosphate synthase
MPRRALPEGVKTLDELELLVVVDNETDTLSSIDDGIPQIPEVARHAALTPPVRSFDGHDCKTVFDQLCCACHGYSVLVTGRRGDSRHSMLFDVGPYPDVWLDNARRLDVDLSRIELVFLSHWHFDHSGGFPEVVSAITRARTAAKLPPPVVDLHPDRPDQRGVLLPTGTMFMLPDEPTFRDIAQAGAVIATHDEPHPVCGGLFHASGPIERVTDYETGLAGHHSFYGDEARPDPLIMEERFVAASVKDRGVTVLSACSHAGIVNVCLGAKKSFPEDPVDLVLGGYHLAGKSMETRIESTVRDLRDRIAPRLVGPGHCTGWRAKTSLANAFAPGAYAPSVVGTTYRLTAA